MSNKNHHIRVEYDPLFCGGDYNGTGRFALIPLDLIEKFNAESEGDGVDLAFSKTTKIDSMHIVSYSMNELFDENGNPVES